MTAPQLIRNRKLSASEMIVAMGNMRLPKNLAEECVNLELMGCYPDDPASAHFYESAREKWHVAPLHLTTEEEGPDFASRTRSQVRRARELIHQDFSKCVHLPWPTVTRIIGHGILPYQLWTVVAVSGHGKTTAAMNLVSYWNDAGVRVYVVGTESPTEVMRVYLAALKLGFPTKLALANRWREMLSPAAQDAVDAELVRQQDEAELLHFNDSDFLTVSGLPRLLEEAADFGAHVILIDHIHNIQSEGRNAHSEFVTACQTLYNFSKNRRIPIVVMGQMHKGTVRDRVRPYLPPDVEMIQMGDVLRQVSAVVMGLYRPLIHCETPQEEARMKARIRLGDPVRPYLKPNTVGLTVMKSRISGDIGDIVDLGYDRGHISDPEPEAEEARYGSH